MRALILASMLLLVACATPHQARMDAEVRRLCAIDGGITVYEKVKLPHGIRIPDKKRATAADDYYLESDYHYYEKGPYEDPALWRAEARIIRRVDGKVLGKSVRYFRRGGDTPKLGHPTSFSCPTISPESPRLNSSVFEW